MNQFKAFVALALACVAQGAWPQLLASAGSPPAPATVAHAARESLRSEARLWAAGQTGIAPELIEIGALDPRIDAPVCQSGFRFDYPFESRATLRAQCSQPPRQFYLRISAERPRQRLVASRALAAGVALQSSDLVTRAAPSGSQGIEDLSQIVGRVLRRAIEAGEAPLSQDLEEVVQVIRTVGDQRAGQVLDPASTKLESIPRSRAPAGALQQVADLRGAKLRRDLPSDRIIVADDLVETRQTFVARRNLMRGETVEPGMFEQVEMDRRALPPDHLGSLQGLDQGELMTSVRAGEPLRASQIRPAMLVKKGQQVVLTVALQGLEISVRVEALEDAKLGDQVKLRNPDSGKALAGVVTGRGSARAL